MVTRRGLRKTLGIDDVKDDRRSKWQYWMENEALCNVSMRRMCVQLWCVPGSTIGPTN